MQRTEQWKAVGEAWVVEAVNAVELAVPDFLNAYRRGLAAAKISLIPLPERVPRIAALLEALLADIDAGLVSTLANAVRAETFENFLDHAVAYRDRGQKDQAGVIAANVFEDTVRKIHADKVGGLANSRKLGELIGELTQKQVITDQQAQQARVARLVRNKASRVERV